MTPYGKARGLLRGVRHFLNWHDNDPQLCWADRGDYLSSDAFREGLALLRRRNLSFDMQLHPHQMAEAAALLQGMGTDAPRVVVDHLGMPAAHVRNTLRASAGADNGVLCSNDPRSSSGGREWQLSPVSTTSM